MINAKFRFFILMLLLLLAEGVSFAQSRQEPLFRFGVVADVQYEDTENKNNRHYRSSLAKLEEAVKVFNREEVEFVISLGDFVNGDHKSFSPLISVTNKMDMALYHVLGNHDLAVDDDRKEEALHKMLLQKTYYSFKKKNWKFIVLDGNDLSLIARKKETPQYLAAEEMLAKIQAENAPNAKPWNGAFSQEQFEWLKKELAASVKKNQQVIILCHFPLYPEKSPHLPWNASDMRSIIESVPNVFAYLNGHVHLSEYFLQNDLHYVTFHGMVEKDENAFAIVSVYRDRIEIKGYGKETSRILTKRK